MKDTTPMTQQEDNHTKTDNDVNPVVTILTAATLALGGIKKYVATFVLPPFWEDLIIAVLLLVPCIYWVIKFFKTSKHARIKKALSAGIVLAQIALGIYYLIPVIGLAFAPAWSICGTINIHNPTSACVVAFDSRDRPIDNTCLNLDDSAYFRESPQHWWIYRPETIAIRQSGTLTPKLHEPSLFSSSCNAVLRPQ